MFDRQLLQVEFVGEEAEDAGGVKKEFFMLLLKEIFDPVYGMFKQSEETNMIWFSTNPFEDDVMYYLIGMFTIFSLRLNKPGNMTDDCTDGVPIC